MLYRSGIQLISFISTYEELQDICNVQIRNEEERLKFMDSFPNGAHIVFSSQSTMHHFCAMLISKYSLSSLYRKLR